MFVYFLLIARVGEITFVFARAIVELFGMQIKPQKSGRLIIASKFTYASLYKI